MSETITAVRPHGAWMASISSRSRLHLFDKSWARWTKNQPIYGAATKCGLRYKRFRTFVEPPSLDLCDDCLLWDFKAEVVYRLYDSKKLPVYAGYSAGLVARLDSHRKSSSWWGDVAFVEWDVYPTQSAALEAEREVIGRERPRHNIRLVSPVLRPMGVTPSSTLTFNRPLFDRLTEECGAHTVGERAEVAGIPSTSLWRLYRSARDETVGISMSMDRDALVEVESAA